MVFPRGDEAGERTRKGRAGSRGEGEERRESVVHVLNLKKQPRAVAAAAAVVAVPASASAASASASATATAPTDAQQSRSSLGHNRWLGTCATNSGEEWTSAVASHHKIRSRHPILHQRSYCPPPYV